MRVLVISHSCVTDVNQQQFVALNQIPDVEVALVIPAIWRNDYTGQRHKPTILPSVVFPIFQTPIAVPGNVSLHFYTTLPLKRLRHFRPDILLSTQEPWSLSGMQAVWLSRLLRVPLVFQTNQNISKQYPFPFSWIERTSYQTAESALAYSEEARQVMVQKGLVCPSQVVPYGTDLSLFQPHPNSILRQVLHLQGKVVLGYIGRLVKEKGLDTLIEAVEIILNQGKSCSIAVLFVGTGAETDALKQRVQDAGLMAQFMFAGAVPHREAPEYMNCIDIFVLPSRTTPTWKEQFGRVIIEALACGVPVIGSDSGQIPILLRETGGGLVFKEGNAEHLAAQILRIVDDPAERHRMGGAGKNSVQRSYTYEAVARQLHEVLRNAVESHRIRTAKAL